MKRAFRLFAALIAVALTAAGCAGSKVYTVVLPKDETNAGGGLKTFDSYTVQDLVPEGMRITAIVGFDSEKRAIGRFERADGKQGLLAVDADKRESELLCLFETPVAQTVVMNTQNVIVYSEQDGTKQCLHRLDASGGEDTTIFMTFARSALMEKCTEPGDGKICAVTENSGRLSVFLIDAATGEHKKYGMETSLKQNIGNYFSQNIKLTDIVSDGQQVYITVLAENKYYIWSAQLGDASEPQNVTVTECSGNGKLCTNGCYYYINDQRVLVKREISSEREYVIVEQADAFSLSPNGQVIAYSQNSGTALKVFAVRKGSRGKTLVDIRPDIESLGLNDDGRLIAVKYIADTGDGEVFDSVGYSVKELGYT